MGSDVSNQALDDIALLSFPAQYVAFSMASLLVASHASISGNLRFLSIIPSILPLKLASLFPGNFYLSYSFPGGVL